MTYRRAGNAVVGCPVAAMLPVPPPLQRQKCIVSCRCCNCMLVMCKASHDVSGSIYLYMPAVPCCRGTCALMYSFHPAVSSPAKGCFWQVEADGRQRGGIQCSSSGRQRPAAALPLPQQRPQLWQNRNVVAAAQSCHGVDRQRCTVALVAAVALAPNACVVVSPITYQLLEQRMVHPTLNRSGN